MKRLRVLELYCGIGGCAAALGDGAEIVAAVDVNRVALGVYRHNFSHPTVASLVGARGVPYKLAAADAFRIRADEIEAQLNSRTRVVIVNEPSNPTGAIAP